MEQWTHTNHSLTMPFANPMKVWRLIRYAGWLTYSEKYLQDSLKQDVQGEMESSTLHLVMMTKNGAEERVGLLWSVPT